MTTTDHTRDLAAEIAAYTTTLLASHTTAELRASLRRLTLAAADAPPEQLTGYLAWLDRLPIRDVALLIVCDRLAAEEVSS